MATFKHGTLMETMISFQHEAFTITAKKYPKKICLKDGDKKISYEQMDNFSNKIANFLIRRGLKPNDRVCLLLEKSFYLYASILGVLKAGGCWVPLSKVFHQNRIKSLIEKIEPVFVICSKTNYKNINKNKAKVLLIDNDKKINKGFSKKNISSESNILLNRKVTLTKNDLAYIIFTSGSTGKPKGVMVTHGNTTDFLNNIDFYFQPKKFLYYSHISEITFDPSIFDIFVCWKNVGTIIPFNKKIYKVNPNLYFKDNKKIEVIFTLPSIIDQLNQNEIKNIIKKIKYLFFTGEPLFLKTINKIKKISKKTDFYNVYGSTETAIISHYYKIKKNEKKNRIPVGKVLPNFRSKLIDEMKEKNIGECYVSGPQLSPGYFKDKISNQKYFKTFKGEEGIKYYNIGDFLKFNKKEEIYEYIGRKDDQIKINGIRLDIQELDSTLLSIEGVADAVSISGKKYNLENSIHTYLQKTDSFNFNEQELLTKLKKELPYYMIPKKLTITKKEFPRNSNGKVIKQQLLKIKSKNKNLLY